MKLETARLVLRPHRAADLDDALAMWSDPEVVRYIGGRPQSREEVWARLLRYVGHWKVMAYGYWVIEDRAGRFVGEAGFADYQRMIEPPLDAPELGWVLVPSAHGRGLATEAVRAALAWGDTRFPRTTCIIDPANLASIRVADKCGFRERARAHYHGSPTIVFERTR